MAKRYFYGEMSMLRDLPCTGLRDGCFEAASGLMLGRFPLVIDERILKQAILCHGLVKLRGEFSGVLHRHAWVEIPELGVVMDGSSGLFSMRPLEEWSERVSGTPVRMNWADAFFMATVRGCGPHQPMEPSEIAARRRVAASIDERRQAE